jgi:hypothetical protein
MVDASLLLMAGATAQSFLTPTIRELHWLPFCCFQICIYIALAALVGYAGAFGTLEQLQTEYVCC